MSAPVENLAVRDKEELLSDLEALIEELHTHELRLRVDLLYGCACARRVRLARICGGVAGCALISVAHATLHVGMAPVTATPVAVPAATAVSVAAVLVAICLVLVVALIPLMVSSTGSKSTTSSVSPLGPPPPPSPPLPSQPCTSLDDACTSTDECCAPERYGSYADVRCLGSVLFDTVPKKCAGCFGYNLACNPYSQNCCYGTCRQVQDYGYQCRPTYLPAADGGATMREATFEERLEAYLEWNATVGNRD